MWYVELPIMDAILYMLAKLTNVLPPEIQNIKMTVHSRVNTFV